MSERHDLLVEVLTEELPPSVLDGIAHDFAKALRDRLANQRLDDFFCRQQDNDTDAGFESFATPKRLVAVVEAVQEKSFEVATTRRGPSSSRAFDENGKKTKAMEGFLNSAKTGDYRVDKHKGEDYVFVDVHTGDNELEKLVGGIVEEALLSITAPRMMRWGSGDLRFVRPIHGVLVVHGHKTLAGKVFGKETATETVGHRFLSKGKKIKVESVDSYVNALADNNVLVQKTDRLKRILGQARKLGLDTGDSLDTGLLKETVAMCEWPTCYRCGFDERFLRLPMQVVVGCMKKHMRCFPVYDGKGLSASFIYVADNEPESPDKLVAGVERVMRARLADADYIFGLDKKMDERSLLDQLKKVAYIRGFGTMLDHCERVAAIVPKVAEALGLDKKTTGLAKKAAMLHKADLGTLMVAEYPDLAGHMAAEYLEKQPDDLRALIKDLFSRELDGAPGDAARDCLVLASETERIVGLGCLVGLPSSSSDPLAMRRSLARVLRVLSRHHGVDLGKFLADVHDVFAEFARSGKADKAHAKKFAKKDKGTFIGQVQWLALRRLAQNDAELLDLGADTGPDRRMVLAVLSPWAGLVNGDRTSGVSDVGFDVAEMKRRLLAVHHFHQNEPPLFEKLLATSKRLSNIADHDPGAGKAQQAAKSSEEGAALLAQSKKAASLRNSKDQWHLDALAAMAGLDNVVDEFFDKVRILDGNEKNNHNLALVKQVNDLFETMVCKTSGLYEGVDWLAESSVAQTAGRQ